MCSISKLALFPRSKDNDAYETSTKRTGIWAARNPLLFQADRLAGSCLALPGHKRTNEEEGEDNSGRGAASCIVAPADDSSIRRDWCCRR